jgi:hypothetical protein
MDCGRQAHFSSFLLMLLRAMYLDRRRTIVIMAATLFVGVFCFLAIRQQVLIGDRQFLRSMNPHHSGAILTCEEAKVRDAEILDLCRRVRKSQRSEIDLNVSVGAAARRPRC